LRLSSILCCLRYYAADGNNFGRLRRGAGLQTQQFLEDQQRLPLVAFAAKFTHTQSGRTRP